MDNSIGFTIKIKWMKTNNTPTIHLEEEEEEEEKEGAGAGRGEK